MSSALKEVDNMARMIYDFTCRITLTYGSIVGTALCIVGVVHLFTTKDATGALGMATIGSGLIIGRSALEKFKPGDCGGGIPTQTPKAIQVTPKTGQELQ